MARNTYKNYNAALRAPHANRFGGFGADLAASCDHDYDNNYPLTYSNAADTASVEAVRVGTDDRVMIGGTPIAQPVWPMAIYTMAANGALADQPFFIANQRYRVMAILEIHATSGNDASAVTGMVKKCGSGVSVATGTALLTSGFDLKGAANTYQTGALATSETTLTLARGDRLAFDYTGTLTTLAGVCVIVFLKPLDRATLDVTFAWNANISTDTCFFIANRPYTVWAISEAHTALGTDVSAVNLQAVKDTGTDAPGTGTNILTNNSNAGFNLKGPINTPEYGTLTGTAATLALATGDRLSVDWAGTPTAVAGVVVTVSLIPVANRTEVTFFYPGAAAANTDQAFFISNGTYKAIAASQAHAVAAGGVSTAQIEKETGTQDPSTGTALLTAAYDLNTAANTVDPDLLVTTISTTSLIAGDRLSVDYASAVQATSGVVITVSLVGE